MRKVRFILFVLMTAAWVGMVSCATTPKGMAEGKVAPKVELERVEVASYFPFDPKIRVPMILAFIFKLENPYPYKVGLESIKFTVAFEGKPGEFFDLAMPMAYESQFIPGKTANQLRVVTVIDSLVVPGTLGLASGVRMAALGLNASDLVKYWYEKIGDFPFAIRVSEGSASFASEKGDQIVGFEGLFPKK